MPNLFGLPAQVYAATVPAGAPSTTPTVAAHARIAPEPRVDKSGSETTPGDQRLANYEARLRQEGSVSPVPNAMAGASDPRGAGPSQVALLRADSVSNPL